MEPSARIAITGLGAVCGAGLDIQAIWNVIQRGNSAVRAITQWDAGNWPVKQAAEVIGVSSTTLLPERKYHKFLSRTDLFGLYATDKALDQSGLITHREQMAPGAAAAFNDRTGVFVGSGGCAYQNSYDFFPVYSVAGGDLKVFGREAGSHVNPMWLLTRLPNNVLCYTGIRYSFKGANACITNQCVGGALAVAEAAAAIRNGDADRAVATGHDSAIEPETLLHYHKLGLLSQNGLRPFDHSRSGTVFGEGAASVVLEKEPDARARQARVLGEFLGSGCTTEATGITAVRLDGDGLSRAIALALAEADLEPGQVGLVVAHGNGTLASDASEARAIQRVFGNDAPPTTAFKWATGHTIAASGVLDVILALTALEKGVVPGIATLECLDPQLAPLSVSQAPQRPRSDIAMVLSRGFGGMNLALLVRGPGAGTRG